MLDKYIFVVYDIYINKNGGRQLAKEKIYDVKTWVLLTKEQHQQITAAADRLGLPVGAFIRMAALEKVTQLAKEA